MEIGYHFLVKVVLLLGIADTGSTWIPCELKHWLTDPPINTTIE